MSIPVKPPGGPTADVPDVADAPPAEAGEFRAVADGALAPEGAGGTDRGAAAEAGAVEAPHVAGLDAQLRSGEIDAEGALDRLVARAMMGARGLPEAERQALEARLREALQQDPTLVALRRDLERASAP